MLILFGIFISSSFYRGWFAENSNNSAKQVHFSALSSSLANTHGKMKKRVFLSWMIIISIHVVQMQCLISFMISYSKCIRRPQNMLSNTTTSICQITKFQNFFVLHPILCLCVLFLFVRFWSEPAAMSQFPSSAAISKISIKIHQFFTRSHIKIVVSIIFFLFHFICFVWRNWIFSSGMQQANWNKMELNENKLVTSFWTKKREKSIWISFFRWKFFACVSEFKWNHLSIVGAQENTHTNLFLFAFLPSHSRGCCCCF